MEFSIFMSVCRFWFLDANSRKEQKQQFWSVREAGRVADQPAGRGRGPEGANRQAVGALSSFFSSKLSARKRAFYRFLHEAFASCIQRSHPAARHHPDTEVCIMAIVNYDVFLWRRTVKASLRLLFDEAQELVAPRIVDKLFLMRLHDLL
jgi:hypothetical protein